MVNQLTRVLRLNIGSVREGVWLSVTPTKEALIVALDFEGWHTIYKLVEYTLIIIYIGVHSIERSTQEDTLLVLFNTAISNLVGVQFLLDKTYPN